MLADRRFPGRRLTMALGIRVFIIVLAIFVAGNLAIG